MGRSTRRAAHELMAAADKFGLPNCENVTFYQKLRPAKGFETFPFEWTAKLPVTGVHGREIPLGRTLDAAKLTLKKLASNGKWGADFPTVKTALEHFEEQRLLLRTEEKKQLEKPKTTTRRRGPK